MYDYLVEVTGLDKFIFDSIDNPTDSTSIRFPECPKCTRQIRRCMRYMPVINRVHNLIEQIKKKILGNRSEHEIHEQRNRLIREYKTIQANLKQIEHSQIKYFFSILSWTTVINHEMLILFENTLIFIKTMDNLLNNGRTRLPIDVFKDQVCYIIL